MGRKKQMIEEIISNFDFEKVENTMQALGWQWATSDYGVPTLQEMLQCAKSCLKQAYNLAKEENNPDIPYVVATGGFSAIAIANTKGKVDFLKLEFIVSEWDVHYNE